jgi:hypothetical protein
VGDLPSARKCRVLLSAAEFDAAQFRAHAAAFFKAGDVHRALAFLEKAPDEGLLDQIKSRAIQEGDAFVMKWVERIGKTKITRDDWTQLAAKARAQGKESFAKMAEPREPE